MVDFTGIKTPFYLYDLDLLDDTLSSASQAAAMHNYTIHYAIKANHNSVISSRIRDYGFGVDCVSGNEIRKALESGFPAKGIVFAGVGKSDADIVLALEEEIFCINCESVEEVEVISDLARLTGRVARIALRVNPSVDAATHHYIATGMDENKFGISLPHLRTALDICDKSPNIEFMGLHFHIGSQITTLEPFRRLCARVNHIWEEFNIKGYGGHILNLGGGFGIDYTNPEGNPIPDFNSFFTVFSENLNVPEETSIHFELGRSLVGQSGRIVTKVLYTKQGIGKKFIIADAGMTELMRPSLYQAKHKITSISSSGPTEKYDVVGPVCESSDVFAKDIELPETTRGDFLQIHSCGAYAESMTLNYNLRDTAGSVYLSGGSILKGFPEHEAVTTFTP
ncbi:MAG: diaminopimelate decarboxylase [Bacteroidales bacterium]